MPELLPVKMLTEVLEKLRETHGQAAYEKARHDVAVEMILKPNGEAFLKNAFPDFDLTEVRAEAEAKVAASQTMPGADDTPQTPEAVLFNLVRQQMPNLKTQAHFNAFMAAFDALRTTLDGYFTDNPERASRAREALNKVLDMASKINHVAEQAAEVPPEERSERLSEYVEPPKQFHEYDDQRRLRVELAAIPTYEALSEWYQANRKTMDRIVSKSLRDELFDAIRQRRSELTAKEAN